MYILPARWYWTKYNTAKLQVNGSVQIGDDGDIAIAEKAGTIRFRSDSNHSYLEMCTQTGVDTYAWVIIKQNSW
jgi:hypothetical protein